MATFQKSVTVRNAELDQVFTTIGASAVIKMFSGAEPANCAAADPSGLLCTITCPASYMNAASGGVKTKTGTWSAASTSAGTIACWRMYDSGVTTCHLQGNATSDMTFDNTTISNGQTVTVNTFQVTAGNA
jgi:hypothetical protein